MPSRMDEARKFISKIPEKHEAVKAAATSVDSVMPKLPATKLAVSFDDVRKQNAVQNASSRLFKMDSSLMGQAIDNANAVTKQVQQQRSNEIQRKLAEVQQQRAKELQAKIAELRHQQEVYFDADREAQLKDANRQLANVGGALPKTTLAGDTVGKGAGIFNQGAANFADFVSNAIPRVEGWLMGVEPEETFTGQLLKPATKATGAVKDYVDTTVAKIDENAAEKIGDSKAKQTAYNLGSNVVAALPQAILAMASGGASAATQLPAQTSGISATVMNAATKALNNPMTKLSFAQSLGNSYEEAKAQGATDMEAIVSATISSYVNAMVETSGGIDTLPNEIRELDLTTPQKVWEWVKSALDEGKEEVVQSVITKLSNKGVFAEDTPLFSATDENAVFNPKRMSGEFATGTAVGGILSGGQMLAQSGINAATKTDSSYNEMMRDIDSIMPRLPQEQSAASQAAQEAAVPNTPNTAPTETNVAQGTADDAVSAVLPNAAEHRDTATQILNDGIFDSPTYGDALEQTGMKRSDVRQALRKIAQNTPGADADAEVRAVVNAIINAEAQPQTQTAVEPEAVEAAQEVPVAEAQQTVEAEQPGTAETNHGVGDIGDMGAKTSDFPHEVKESQTHGIDSVEAMLGVPEERRKKYVHDAITEEENLHNAGLRFEQDYDGEKAYLENTLQWTGEDVDTAHKILEDLEAKAEAAETEEAWNEYEAWRDIVQQHESRLGGGLQAIAKYARMTGSKIVQKASEALKSAREGTNRAAVMNTVSGFSKQFDAASKAKDVDGLLKIIRETAATRKTDTRKGGLSKEIDWALQRIADYARAELVNANPEAVTEPVAPIQNYKIKTGDKVTVSDRNNVGTIVSVNDDGTYTVHFKSKQGQEATKTFTGDMVKKLGQKKTAITYLSSTSEVGKFYDFLRNFAANGIEAIATDKQRVSFGAGYRTIQHNSILSKFVTVARNLVSNGVLDPLDSFAGNLVVPVDALLSKFTKTRSVAFDKSWFSEAKRKGSMDGLAMALLEIGLDVNSDGAVGKYEDVGKRTFHMSNGGIAKLISTWEKYAGYLMGATDEFSKGGVEAEVQRGIDSLYEQGKIKDDTLKNAGEQAALYRTLQDETIPSRVVTGIRGAVNNIPVGRDLGLGDVAIKFAQVPANITARVADFSPLGLTRGIGKLAKVMWDAKHDNLTAAQQASAVKDIGRGITGTGMIIAATAMALKGIIHVVAPGGEDENKNKAASEAAQGLKEVQLNLSSLLRSVKGEDTTFRPDDKLVSIGFLDPINAHLMTGALIAEDIEEARKAGKKIGFGDIAKDSLQGVVHSVWNLPLMDPIKDIYYALQKSDGDNFVDKGFDVANAAIAGEVASFVPNALKGVAQGLDPYQRDFYTKDTLVGQTVDSIIGGIPFARKTLPTKQDVYGNDIKNPNQPLNFLNANILPGSVTTYSETELQAALNALSEESGKYSMYLTKKPPASITNDDGDTVKLTNKQQRQFMTERGDLYEVASAALEDNDTYQGFSIDWKLDAYDYAKDYVTQKAKESLDAGFKPDGWVSDLDGATPEEFSDALVLRVVEHMAGKEDKNKSVGMSILLENGTIDDQLALACMSETCFNAYTNNLAGTDITVQQFLEVYGKASKYGKTTDEKQQIARDMIKDMDIQDSELTGTFMQAISEAIPKMMKLDAEVPEQELLDIGDIGRIENQMGTEQRKKYDVFIKDSSVDMQTYLDFREFLGSEEAKGKKDNEGNAIKGESRMDHAIAWLEKSNYSDEEKGRLFCSEFARDNCPIKWRTGLPKMPKK